MRIFFFLFRADGAGGLRLISKMYYLQSTVLYVCVYLYLFYIIIQQIFYDHLSLDSRHAFVIIPYHLMTLKELEDWM